jgi:hypothetical protein
MALKHGDVVIPPEVDTVHVLACKGWSSPTQPGFVAPFDNDMINSYLAARKTFVYIDKVYSMSVSGAGITARKINDAKMEITFLGDAPSGDVQVSFSATWTHIVDGYPVGASSGIETPSPVVVTVRNTQGNPSYNVNYPKGSIERPKSGSTKIGTVTVTVSLRTGETLTLPQITPLRASGSIYFQNQQRTGNTATADMYLSSSTALGNHGFRVRFVTKVDGKTFSVTEDFEDVIEVLAIPVDPPVTPDPPDPDDPDPYVPDPFDPDIPPYEPPVLEYHWELRQETQITTALAEPDGSVLWATTETTRYNGEKDLSTETLPKKRIDDYLPQPTQVLPIKRISIDSAVAMEDEAAIEALGPIEKSKRVQNIASEGALTAMAYYYGEQCSRCAIRYVETPLMPLVARGDLLEMDGDEWHVETASHDLASKKSTLRLSKTPSLEEIAEVLKSPPQKIERAIVALAKAEAGKVDNATRAKIVAKIDYRTYDALPIGGNTPIRVNLDRAVHGDLQIGTVVLIGQPTRR